MMDIGSRVNQRLQNLVQSSPNLSNTPLAGGRVTSGPYHMTETTNSDGVFAIILFGFFVAIVIWAACKPCTKSRCKCSTHNQYPTHQD